MDAALEELVDALDQLDSVLAARIPVVHAGFRPGLSDEEIDRLAEPLAPLFLPLDLRVLYRWHNGHDPFIADGYTPVFPDELFLDLGQAVVQYSWWRGGMLENPLWFPAFGDQSGAFVTLGTSRDQLAGPVWDFHYQDPDLSIAFDSILAMVKTFTATWNEADPTELDFVDLHVDLRREHTPLSIDANGRRRHIVNMIHTRGWPQDWLDAAGVGPMEPEPDDQVISIAEFFRDPRFDRPLRGTLDVRAGSGEWTYARLTDATGSVELLLLADRTENTREVHGGMQAEVRLAPLPDIPDPMPLTGEELWQALDPRGQEVFPRSLFANLEDSFTADYLVSRVIPL